MPAPARLGAGLRDQRVTVERLTETPDGGGGVSRAWTVLGSLWVAAKWVGGSEQPARGAVREVVRYRFTADAGSAEALGITAADRIIWRGEPYNIRERPRRQATTRDLDIYAESGVTQ